MLNFLWGAAAAGIRPEVTVVSDGRAAAKAESVEEHLKELEDRLDRLTLVSMAMWSLLQERGELTEEDLLERVKELDLRDGVLDGKVTPKVANCPKCKRVMSPRHRRCLYCGYQELSVSAFDQTL